MSSRQVVSALVLVILMALPMSGAVCALVCDTPEPNATAGHHGPAKDCGEPAPFPTGVQIAGDSEHDCSTHAGAIRPASLTAAEKTNPSVTWIPLASHLVSAGSTAPLNSAANPQNISSPPGTAPPPAPLVLRI